MFKNLKKFIQNLQAAEEGRKKRWLFILSSAAMILVVSAWAVYINKTIINLGETNVKADKRGAIQTVEADSRGKESFWQVFSTGVKTITDQIKNLIKTGREISIEGNNPDFAPKPETGQ